MNLQQRLMNEIYNATMKHCISHIITHPITFKKLLDEIGMPNNLTDYKFMGYKVYRSEDVEINKFIIGWNGIRI